MTIQVPSSGEGCGALRTSLRRLANPLCKLVSIEKRAQFVLGERVRQWYQCAGEPFNAESDTFPTSFVALGFF